jgi:hypothetical protein
MAQLTVNFTPVSGITSYEICYVPTTGGIGTCITVSSSPAVITTGIECGVSYNVTVKTNCPPGEYQTDQSTAASTVATLINCPVACMSFTASTTSAQGQTTTYTDCDGAEQQVTIGGVSGYDASTFCAQEGSVQPGAETSIAENGPCEGSLPGNCYTVDVPYEDIASGGQQLYFHYNDPHSGYTLISTQMIPVIDTGLGIRFGVCSTTGAPTFRYGYSGYDQVIPGIIVTQGGPCDATSQCAPLG